MMKLDAYFRMFKSALTQGDIDKAVLWGARWMNSAGGINNRHHFFEAVLGMMGALTPRQFVELFPIEKVYDGKRWGTKDFFSTVQMINEHGWDTPIGDAFEFLWDYDNRNTREFAVNYMSAVDDVFRSNGGLGMVESFCLDKGIETYRMYTDAKGKQYLQDSKGRTHPVRNPRHLKIVKRNGA